MDFVPSAHQAAGHDGCLTAGPVFAKRASLQEINFYAEANSRLSAGPDILGSKLAHWMPMYMGTMTAGYKNVDGAMVLNPENVSPESLAAFSADPTEKPYLVLQNLYHGFVHPCILDIKLGSVLTDDTVTPEKKERLAAVSRSTTSGSLSFRICGMKIFSVAEDPVAEIIPNMSDYMQSDDMGVSGTYTSFNKYFGRALDETTVEKAIDLFFSKRIPCRNLLLTRFLQRLQVFYNCLLDTEVRIKSGSLLFIYEGEPTKWAGLDEEAYLAQDPLLCEPLEAEESDESDSDSESGPLSRMNLIDFAHAKYADGQGPDDNIIDGVENLMRIFEGLVAA